MKVIYSNTTHRDFVRGLTWSTESQLYTCAWDSKILLHDITKQTATFMGESSSCKLEVNGDIADHPVENGSGDVGTDVDKSKLDQCKLSYSQAVKSQPEMSAEG